MMEVRIERREGRTDEWTDSNPDRLKLASRGNGK
jgi:hypothetical protein